MLTLPDTLNNLLNKYVSTPIIKLHELGHAKAISKAVKKNPNLSNVKPIILIGDYKNFPDPIYIDEEKRIIGFKQIKGNAKGITLHPDFAKMSDEELKICLKAGHYREVKVCLPICILFFVSAIACNSLVYVLIVSIIIILFFICYTRRTLKSSDWLYAKNPTSFRHAKDWTALYFSYVHLVTSDKDLDS